MSRPARRTTAPARLATGGLDEANRKGSQHTSFLDEAHRKALHIACLASMRSSPRASRAPRAPHPPTSSNVLHRCAIAPIRIHTSRSALSVPATFEREGRMPSVTQRCRDPLSQRSARSPQYKRGRPNTTERNRGRASGTAVSSAAAELVVAFSRTAAASMRGERSRHSPSAHNCPVRSHPKAFSAGSRRARCRTPASRTF